MKPDEKEVVLKIINDLWAHDPWRWGMTCANLINNEINFDSPAIVTERGKYAEVVITMRDGREFEIGYVEGGWYMGYVKPGNPKIAIAQDIIV